MAGNLKGITIEFQGDTTKLDKALRDVDKSTRDIDSELKKVNTALKFNPTSVELWRQKQDLLKQKITETKTRLDALKAAQKQMDDNKVDKNSEQYKTLRREIITTESKLKTFKGQLAAVGNVNLRAASEQMKAIGSKATAAGNAMRGVSKAAAAVAASIGLLTKKSAKWADDIVTQSKVYGVSTKELQKYNAAADLVDVKAEAIVATHRKLERNMLNAALGSKKQALAFEELGIEYKNADGSLRDGDKVWQDTIKALSKMENVTERDAYAMALMGRSATDLNPLILDGAEGYEILAKAMEKYDLDFVDEDTLKRANDFNDQMDLMKAVTYIAFQNIGTELAGVFLPALKKVVDWVGNLANWISKLNPNLVATVGVIAGIVAAIAPALLIFGALASAAGAVAGALASISLPIVGIVAGIAALGAAFVAAYTKSAPFREAINSMAQILVSAFTPVLKAVVKMFKVFIAEIKTTAKAVAADLGPVLKTLMPVFNAIAKLLAGRLKTSFTIITTAIKLLGAAVRGLSTVFSGVFTKIVSTIQSAVGRIKSAMAKIKSLLSGHLSFPKIKLPHFSFKGKFSLNPPSVPTFSVSWYKTGGIFNSPTIAGIGEAGPEAVIPLDKLWNKLDAIVAASTGGNTINVYGTPGMDTKALALEVERVLVQQQKQRLKAWGY